MLSILRWLKFDSDVTFIFFIFWIIYTIPVLFLHVEYYLCNRNETFTITDNEILLDKNGITTTYKKSDIKEIIVYMAPNVVKRNYFRYLPIESYYYGRIKTNAGEELIITSLLTLYVRETMKQLDADRYFVEERLFCTLLIKD